MDSDTTLLERFTAKGCERSFACLTEKYAGMVFAVAHRRVGSRELAEEVSQNVFLALARKTPQLRHNSSLAAWLHRVTMLESAAMYRAELRRRRRHEKLATMNETEPDRPMDPDSLPILDDAVQKLKESERELLFRRFLEGLSFSEIGNLYGIPEATGRKRISRIIKKLSLLMGRKGVAVSVIALGTAMTGHWAKASPVGLAQNLSQTALAGSLASPSNATLLFAMMTTKISTVAVVALGAAIPFSMQWAHSKRASDVPALAVAEDGIVAPIGSAQPSAQKTTAAVGFSIAALARELRKLPLSNGSLKRELELEILMHTLTEEQIKQVVPLLKDAPNASALHRIVGAVFGRWAEFDPGAAAAAATDFDKMRAVAQRGVILSWVKRDPESAFAFMESSVLSTSTRADSRAADELLETVLRVTGNHARALERMESLANPDMNKAMVASVLKAWARQESPDKAFAWIHAKEDYGTRNAYMKTYLRDLALFDPAKGFELALTIEQPNLREESARWLLMQWRDRPKAREAYLNLPESVRTEHLTRNVAPFLSRDPEAAFEVASRLPEGFHRDQFQYGGIQNIVERSPEQAAEAVERITHESTRDDALKYIGRSWLKQDAERARQWLDNESGLARKSIDKLLKGEN